MQNQFVTAELAAAAAIVATSRGKDAAETTDGMRETAGAEDKSQDENKLLTKRTRSVRDRDAKSMSSGQLKIAKRELKIACWKIAQAELQSSLVSFWGYRFDPDNFTAEKLRRSRRRQTCVTR
jgi:hypothetical protein